MAAREGSKAQPSSAPLLERDREQAAVERVLESAREASGGILLIEGPPGIGKTELVLWALRRAEAEGMAVASARASEFERELAFGIVRQLLERSVARSGEDEARELFAGAAGLARPVFEPWALVDVGSEPGADQTFSALHGLYWLCANLTQRTPWLLAIDDAHWADLASLRFLAYLGARLEGLAIALLVATRPPERPVEEEALGRLERDPRATKVSPAPLTVEAISSIIAGETGDEPELEFARACERATGGVPLLVRELGREFGLRGIAPVANSAGRVAEVGPRTIGRYVVARVRRLMPEAERIARAAAVLGPDAELPRVAELARVEVDTALTALDALAAAGVISSLRPLEFAHPVVRAAIYGELAAGERGRMHGEAAAMLAAQGIAEERVASHLLTATPSGDPQAVRLLVRTARAASARGAPGSAAAYLERALAEPPDAAARGDVLHELGQAEVHAGRSDHAEGHLREALRLTAAGRARALIARDLAGCLRLRWRHGAASRVIAKSLAELGPSDGDLALSLKAELALIAALEPTAHADLDTRIDLSELAQRGSEATAKCLAALTADAGVRRRRSAAEVRELAAGARDAGILDDLAHGGSLWINAVAPLVVADGFALAETMLAEAFDAAGQRSSVVFTSRAYVSRSLLRLRQGDLREAQADAEAALATGGDLGFVFAVLSLGVLVDAHRERGDLDAAEAALTKAGLDDEIPDTFIHNFALRPRAEMRVAAGRLEAGIADLDELGRRLVARGQDNPALHPWRSALATALLRLGEAERARALAEEELDLARPWGARRAIGIALRAVGLCEAADGDLAHLRESVEVLAGTGAELEHARSLVELGAAIRRLGTRAQAREHLREGMELAHHCGAAPLVERAREELLATGARPRRIVRTGIAALTPSQLRVAHMAAEGLTNREIAQALFVTQRTVEGHLTHAFQKLDVTSRGQLAERLAAEADFPR
jgi:DNA-binding CsgD family transcriptional regulator/tetratricopeptide (TPR) repeat protein